jgi:hypothetical protein
MRSGKLSDIKKPGIGPRLRKITSIVWRLSKVGNIIARQGTYQIKI